MRCVRWAEFGEHTSHPITRELAASKKLAMKCYSGRESFTPSGNNKQYNMFHIYTAPFTNDSCHAKGEDLMCQSSAVPNFYNRLAYHTFNSIHGKLYASLPNITTSRYVISNLYKHVLKNDLAPSIKK